MADGGKKRPTVMISTTARDLPEHRGRVMDACQRQDMFPKMMEHLPASGDDAIKASLKMVGEADIYLGVFAFRYGYVPKGYDVSITEMEYNRAVERKIPRLIFLMHDDHPVKPGDVETGPGAELLKKFKERLKTDQVVNFFKSPADLRGDIINSLSRYRKSDVTQFHYISDIPASPGPYVAHPYVLLQTRNLVGRQSELNLLTDWVAKPTAESYQARVLCIVAIGGMGKSALTWKWFNDIAPQEMKPLAGRMWWSFYESDATFENFVTRALAYVTRRPTEEVERIPAPDRESQLLAALDREPYLVVLDGLERILIAYARMDAARMSDDDLDEKTSNQVASALGLPQSAAQSFPGKYHLRKTTDPRTGGFLRKLASVRSSRILVSTRLYPADLQTGTGEPIPGSLSRFLHGLNDDDALDLWRAFGVTGSHDELLRLFHTFENHPLVIRSLASEIANYRRTPGDFDKWRRSHPDFDPFRLPLVQVKSHILDFSFRGLDEEARKVLWHVAAFRMPATYDTLTALLVGDGKLFPNESVLDSVLVELEDRGLLGWDKRSNRYDSHPIVRGVVWGVLTNDIRRVVYTSLNSHFRPLAPSGDSRKVLSIEALTGAIELYNTLIGLDRYDEAFDLYYQHLGIPLRFRLSAGHQMVALLEMLFPDGVDHPPRLSGASREGKALNALAHGYEYFGQIGRAVPLFRRYVALCKIEDDKPELGVGLRSLSRALRSSGYFYDSENMARQALEISQELRDNFRKVLCRMQLGLTLAARGKVNEGERILLEALPSGLERKDEAGRTNVRAYQAQVKLWRKEFRKADRLALKAFTSAQIGRNERDLIRAARLLGAAALGMQRLPTADEKLHSALSGARAVNFIQEELAALIALAELRRRQGNLKPARELLDDVWEPAERGPYPLLHTDAYDVLAQIERDVGNREAAIAAATKAYRLAWCDGPPYAYDCGLAAAKKHLAQLGAPEPTDLPPFDESKFEPILEVEIKPTDEFHA